MAVCARDLRAKGRRSPPKSGVAMAVTAHAVHNLDIEEVRRMQCRPISKQSRTDPPRRRSQQRNLHIAEASTTITVAPKVVQQAPVFEDPFTLPHGRVSVTEPRA